MKLRLTNNLQRYEWFWKARGILLRHIDFPVNSFLWKVGYKKDNFKESSSIFIRSIQSVLSTLVLAALILLLVNLPKLFFNHIPIAGEGVSTIISTIVTVAGIVIGLYYAGLTSAAGGLFMKAPKSLQDVFLSEKEGGQYIKIITITTAMGLFYLCAPVLLNMPISIIDLLVIMIFAVYSVMRILSIGPLSFYFIHPIRLAHKVYADTTKAMQKVAYKNFGYDKDYLQDHNRKIAKNQIGILRDLIDFSIVELKISPAQLLQIAMYAGAVLEKNISLKKSIPMNSLWFEQKYKHKKWLFTDESTVQMAIDTGTSIQPDTKANPNWLEESLVDIILGLTQNFAKQSNWIYAYQCLEILTDLVESLGAELDIDNVSYIIEKTELLLANTVNENHTDSNKEYLTFIDSVGRLYISASLGLRQFIGKYGLDSVAKTFLNITQDEKSVLSAAYPEAMSNELQNIRTLLSNEYQIEGKIISPDWYIQTLSMRHYCNSLVRYYDNLTSINAGIERILAVLKKNDPLAATVLASRITELFNKKLHIANSVSEIIDKSQQYNKVDGLQWLEMDKNSIEKVAKDFEHSIDLMTEMIDLLIKMPKEQLQDLPDFLGQAYSYGLEATYRAAANNDDNRLSKLFGRVMIGSFKVRDDIVGEMEGWIEQTKIIMSTETLEDLFELSGFIKIYSELYDNPKLWESCEKAWGVYLDNGAIPERSILEYFIAVEEYRNSQFVLKRNDSLSCQWQFQLKEMIKKKGFDKNVIPASRAPGEIGFDNPISTHKSPLARLVINASIEHLGMDVNASDLFFGIYLSKRKAADGLKFPDRSHIMSRLKFETERKIEDLERKDDE